MADQVNLAPPAELPLTLHLRFLLYGSQLAQRLLVLEQLEPRLLPFGLIGLLLALHLPPQALKRPYPEARDAMRLLMPLAFWGRFTSQAYSEALAKGTGHPVTVARREGGKRTGRGASQTATCAVAIRQETNETSSDSSLEITPQS